MTVAISDALTPFLGDGVTKVFTYDFPITVVSDMKVLLDGQIVEASEYTVSLTPKTVTFTIAPADGAKGGLFRDTAIAQDIVYSRVNSSMNVEALAEQLDKIVLKVQENAREVSFAVKTDYQDARTRFTGDFTEGDTVKADGAGNFIPGANADQLEGFKNAAANSAAAAATSETNSAISETNAAASAVDAANFAAGVNLPPIDSDDAGKALIVKSDGSGYEAGGGTSGRAVLAAEDTAALTTALAGAVDANALASSVYATEAEAQDLDESTASAVKLMTPLRIISALKSFDPVNIDWFGVNGDANTNDASDDTTALQDALDVFKAPDMSKLPPVGAAWASRAFNGRVLDLKGRCYNVTNTLNADTAYGLTLQNGSLIARGDPWAANAPIFTALNGVSLRIHNMTFEGNQLADGIVLDRCVYGIVTNTNIWGIGTRTFGLKSPTDFGGMCLVLDKVNIYGKTAAETSDTDSTYQATGFLIAGGSDSMMTNCNTNRVRVGANIAKGGWFLIGNHFTGTGDPNTTDDVGLSLSAGAHYQQVTGNQFDNCNLQLWGYAKRNVVNNVWRSDSLNELSCGIRWAASTANEPLGQGIITNNFVQLNGTPTSFDFIKLIEGSGKTFGDVSALRVGDNTILQQSGTAIRSSATYGRFSAAVGAGSFDAGHKTYIDMTNYVLKGSASTTTPVFKAWAAANTGSGARTFQGYTFTNATDKLALQFDADFTGNVVVNWSYGDEEAPITATST